MHFPAHSFQVWGRRPRLARAMGGDLPWNWFPDPWCPEATLRPSLAWPGLATVNELPLPWPHCCAPPAPSSPPCAVWPPVMRFLSVTYKLPSMGGLLCFFAGFGKTSNTRKECLRETRLSPEHLLSYEPVTFYKPFKCS